MATTNNAKGSQHILIAIVPARLALFVAIAAILLGMFGLGQAWKGLVLAFGHVEVVLQVERGQVFTGIWLFGAARTFKPALVHSVQVQRTDDATSPFVLRDCIVLVGLGSMQFGEYLSLQHQQFIASTLSRLLGSSPITTPTANK